MLFISLCQSIYGEKTKKNETKNGVLCLEYGPQPMATTVLKALVTGFPNTA